MSEEPWICFNCGEERVGEPAKITTLGPIDADCWILPEMATMREEYKQWAEF